MAIGFIGGVTRGKSSARMTVLDYENKLWGQGYGPAVACQRLHCTLHYIVGSYPELVPLSKALSHICFIRGQGCNWCSHRPKLTLSVISDVEPIITFTFYYLQLITFNFTCLDYNKVFLTIWAFNFNVVEIHQRCEGDDKFLGIKPGTGPKGVRLPERGRDCITGIELHTNNCHWRVIILLLSLISTNT